MVRKILIALCVAALASIGIAKTVDKARVEKKLESYTAAYWEETKKDKSWDCNPEIKDLVDALEKAERERDDYQQKYLRLLVEKQQRIN